MPTNPPRSVADSPDRAIVTHYSQVIEHRLHSNETRVWGDSAYRGQGKKLRQAAPNALDFTNKKGRRNAPLTDRQEARTGPNREFARPSSIHF